MHYQIKKQTTMARCMLKVKCADKHKVLDIALCSCANKMKGGNTYLWYHSMNDAKDDKSDLLSQGIESEIIKGWENDGFVTFMV